MQGKYLLFLFKISFFVFILTVYNNIKDFPEGLATVVSVGTFDGVHKGHQAILRQMTDIAKKNNLVSVVLTFDPHPRYALEKDHEKLRLLSTTEEKIAHLKNSGIDHTIVINFTPEFAKIPYEEFIKNYLVDSLGAKYIVIGFDHRFGENRSGNHQALIELSAKYGYQVFEVKALFDNNSEISSTKIRNLIRDRQIEQANVLLNYNYTLGGTVVKGTQTGKKLGFPTVNLSLDDPSKLIPATGVYYVRIGIGSEMYDGMCNIGFKPTFEKQPLTIETHIFNFDKDIYGENIRIYFISFIRNEQKFESTNLLKAQLEQDKQHVFKKINEERL